ncbi:MAG: amphi-Trp domain-containing protein [Salinivenus sp.]
MPEETLFKFERSMTRADAAAYLRSVAEKLEADGALQLTAGARSHTVDVPDQFEFEVKVERETGQSGAEIGVEFELEWKEGGEASADGPLEIK